MERLVALYPKRDYWLSVLHTVVTRPGFNDRLAIDVSRLKLDVGMMRSADEYLDYGKWRLIRAPLEASRVIDKGYAAGVLGTGPEAARHKRLKDLAAKNLAEDKKTMAQGGSGTKDDKALFNEGFNTSCTAARRRVST